jgi:hypothetical protein
LVAPSIDGWRIKAKLWKLVRAGGCGSLALLLASTASLAGRTNKQEERDLLRRKLV